MTPQWPQGPSFFAMAPSLFSLCTTSCSLMMFRCCISLRREILQTAVEGTQAEGAARPALRSGASTACLASAALGEMPDEEAGEAAMVGIDC